jgi:hypothetical protein
VKPARSHVDRLAEALAWHDAAAGYPGGDLEKCARGMKITLAHAEALFARIKADLGGQAW